MKSEELTEIILTNFGEVNVQLTHDQRVAKIRELEQANRADILEVLDILLGPYISDADVSR